MGKILAFGLHRSRSFGDDGSPAPKCAITVVKSAGYRTPDPGSRRSDRDVIFYLTAPAAASAEISNLSSIW